MLAIDKDVSLPRAVVRGVVFGLVILTAAVSCGGEEDLSLDVETAADDPRFDPIRRRLDITILPGEGWEGHGTVVFPCSPDGCSPAAFEEAVTWACYAQTAPGRNVNSSCGEVVAAVEAFVCAATVLMQVGESPMETEVPLNFPAINNITIVARVPPQDAESNAELASHAVELTGRALRWISLTPALGCSSTDWSAPAGSEGLLAQRTLADELAGFYGEAIELALDSGDLSARAGAAVSDAAFARRTDNAEASQDALAPFASRTAAAHLLVGGAFGLPALRGVAESGFYSRPRLSGEAQYAIQLIRAAAIRPAHVLSSAITVDDLVQGSGGVSAQESIRFRLGHMQSRDALLDATNASQVFEILGVSRANFSEAREHLREELLAFDRSPDAVLPADRLPDGTLTSALGIVLYGATRLPPRQLPPSYWAAVLRFDPTPARGFVGTFPTFAALPPWPRTPSPAGDVPAGDTFGAETEIGGYVRGRRTLASILDQAQRSGPALMDHLCPASTCANADLERARALIATAMTGFGINPERITTIGGSSAPPAGYNNSSAQGRARACLFGTVPLSEPPGPGTSIGPFYNVLIQVEARPDAEDLVVVRGHEGLDCALRGEVEGAPCDAWWPDLLVFDGAWVAEGEDVYSAGVSGQAFGDRPNDDILPLFVVRRIMGEGAPLPGQFEELVGFLLPAPATPGGTGYLYCTGAAISSDLDNKAADLIAPATEAPYRSATSCAGLPSDLRIPLENELTSDDAGGSPGIESSWRHYLELARRSAGEADALGEDLIRSGLELELRAEAATDELSQLCGVAINLTSISGAISGEGAPPAEAPSGPPCMVPYRQEGESCVLDASSTRSRRRRPATTWSGSWRASART